MARVYLSSARGSEGLCARLRYWWVRGREDHRVRSRSIRFAAGGDLELADWGQRRGERCCGCQGRARHAAARGPLQRHAAAARLRAGHVRPARQELYLVQNRFENEDLQNARRRGEPRDPVRRGWLALERAGASRLALADGDAHAGPVQPRSMSS
jgi:hypothetical protein